MTKKRKAAEGSQAAAAATEPSAAGARAPAVMLQPTLFQRDIGSVAGKLRRRRVATWPPVRAHHAVVAGTVSLSGDVPKVTKLAAASVVGVPTQVAMHVGRTAAAAAMQSSINTDDMSPTSRTAQRSVMLTHVALEIRSLETTSSAHSPVRIAIGLATAPEEPVSSHTGGIDWIAPPAHLASSLPARVRDLATGIVAPFDETPLAEFTLADATALHGGLVLSRKVRVTVPRLLGARITISANVPVALCATVCVLGETLRYSAVVDSAGAAAIQRNLDFSLPVTPKVVPVMRHGPAMHMYLEEDDEAVVVCEHVFVPGGDDES
jgi:hypothetical protein